MTITLQKPDITELKPRITVFGVGGGGGNAVNNMITAGLQGVDFVVANTDAQALTMTKAQRVIQLGVGVTEGLGAGSQPEVGRAAAEECIDEIIDHLNGTHMCFVTAGMGGGTGTGAAPIVAQAARNKGILTVGVVTKPFQFEGGRRMRLADAGIEELQKSVDTLIVIPNQNLFRIANDKTTFADAFAMADQVLYSGVACITDLMVKEGLINLDFADVRSVMREMGRAMMGTGEASGEGRAMQAAEAAIANPLLDETSMRGAQGLLISITGGRDLTLFEVDEAATRIREEVDPDANIILGATFDEELEGIIRVSVVATGIDRSAAQHDDDRAFDQRRETRAPEIRTSTGGQGNGPVSQAQPKVDPIAETIRSAEVEMERELQMAVTRMPQAPQAPQQQPREMMQPKSQIFAQEPRPAAPRPAVAPQPAPQQPRAAAPQPAPQQPRPQASEQQRRMPEVSDFPPLVQPEMNTSRRHEQEERGPKALFKRLSNTLGRGDESFEGHHVEQAPRRETAQQAPQSNPYAPRRQAEQPAQQRQDDDQFDIPAFLRRQAN
ncbi:cell division protein FtsZ [Martelella endophytica]|uniref:Cell division protein FtsZ n=1 Tax=Martelella endophytica TaxID=1486262 RepID=A0A0D5LSV2_MAREN|nr:cell division protein FtsZ [Martelella endophytica]AJY47171.1 cell division protein FtsZ [Martelella endophytica]